MTYTFSAACTEASRLAQGRALGLILLGVENCRPCAVLKSLLGSGDEIGVGVCPMTIPEDRALQLFAEGVIQGVPQLLLLRQGILVARRPGFVREVRFSEQLNTIREFVAPYLSAEVLGAATGCVVHE